MILIYIPCKDEKEAEKISEYLLKERLIACSNIFPVKSMYRWDGKIEKESETVILAKTKHEKYDEIKKVVKKLHSYDIPAIIKIPSEANEEYDRWVGKELR